MYLRGICFTTPSWCGLLVRIRANGVLLLNFFSPEVGFSLLVAGHSKVNAVGG